MIYIVCNNANMKIDGIGDYAYRLSREMLKQRNDVQLFTGKSGKSGIINKMMSFAMTRVLLDLLHKIKYNDKVIIEYPFAECNIILIPVLHYIRKIVKKANCSLILSLHEYERVNFYRKLIIRKIIPYFDVVLVTDIKAGNLCDRLKVPYKERLIPSNIYNNEEMKVTKDQNLYVFFGLLDKTKAIDEMIDAWKEFNYDKTKRLIIISSSNYENSSADFGVEYYKNLESDKIAKIFSSAQFCVLPIKPCVYINNATYKTAICYECIQIGCFEKKLNNKNVSINIKDYSKDEILTGLRKSANLSKEEISLMRVSFSKIKKPSFRETVSQYFEVINS